MMLSRKAIQIKYPEGKKNYVTFKGKGNILRRGIKDPKGDISPKDKHPRHYWHGLTEYEALLLESY